MKFVNLLPGGNLFAVVIMQCKVEPSIVIATYTTVQDQLAHTSKASEQVFPSIAKLLHY